MRFKTISFFIFFGFTTANAIENCVVSDDTTSTKSMQSMLKQIKFPDGRTFTIIGAVHGDADKSAELIDSAFSYSVGASKEQLIKSLKGVVYSQQERHDHEITAKREIYKYLQQNIPSIDNVALESSPEQLRRNLEADKINERYTFVDFDRRGITDPILRTDMMLLMSGPARLLALREPGLFKKTRLVPAEGAARKRIDENPKLSARYLHEIQIRITDLAKSKNLPVEMIRKIWDTWQEDLIVHYTVILKNWRPMVDMSVEKLPLGIRSDFVKALEESKPILETIHQRDLEMVQNLTALSGNSALIVGTAHAKPILEILKEKCLADNAKSPKNVPELQRTN